MGAKSFHGIEDFFRHGQHLYITCRNGHCEHFGIVASYDAYRYFKLHRWTTSFDGFGDSCLNHFRCSKCAAKAGSIKPTENAPTVLRFFPADEKGWQMLQRRLRG